MKAHLKTRQCLLLCAVTLCSIRVSSGDQSSQPDPLLPENVVVVANDNVSESLKLARHYMEARGIPQQNLVELDASPEETIGWEHFLERIRDPLLAALKEGGWLVFPQHKESASMQNGSSPGVLENRIAHMVLCYGIPLRISHNPALLDGEDGSGSSRFRTTRASVDSELATLPWVNSPVVGFVRNPYFLKAKNRPGEQSKVIRVHRLDGPSPVSAMRLVDNALLAEDRGLRGRAYLDLGGPHRTGDQWLMETAHVLESLGFDTVRNESKSRFSSGDRFDAAAFYFGWYARHVDGVFQVPGFQFAPGAIGFHIHSGSATSLRSMNRYWTGPLIRRGVTATVGNVYEPYLELTHHPQILIRELAAGLSWGEAVYKAIPVLSWQSLSIGDPLYQPFRKPLSDQLDQGSVLPDEYGQYPVIRLLNLMETKAGTQQALDLGKKWFNEQPGVALGLHLLGMADRLGKEEDRRYLLEVLSRVKTYSINEYGVAIEVVETLARNEKTHEALSLVEAMLVQPDLPRLIETDLLERGQSLAGLEGKISLQSEWAERIKALNEEK